MTDYAGIGRADYHRFCGLLELAPDDALSPAQRAAALPPGICPELVATPHAVARLKAWMVAGAPAVTVHHIARLRYAGNDATFSIIGNHLLAGVVAPPAIWYLLQHVAVFAIGADARGLTVPAPPARYERLVLLNDAAVTGEELVSACLHEFAHAWLLPPPPRDLSPTEDQVYATDVGFWTMAERHGLVEEQLKLAIEDEHQACRLARQWGATGTAADGQHCSMGPRHALERARARMALLRPCAVPSGPGDVVSE
jgi:hypothetical protein